MKNGVGAPQGVLLVGGTSDIGVAILRRLVGRTVARVALVSRDTERARVATADLESERPETDWHHQRADLSRPGDALEAVREAVHRLGDVDVALLAAGELTRDGVVRAGADDLDRVVGVNMTAPIAIMEELADRMLQQGGGTIVLLSTVAMERVRPANALYASAKAGVDAYARALDQRLAGTGVRVMIVRPGFVASKMTQGMDPAPLSTTPDKVAEAAVRGLRRGRRIVWAPGALRPVFAVFRHLPEWIWRRLPI